MSLSRELANELALLGGLEATMGDDLYRQLQNGTLAPGGNLAALEAAARQTLLNTPTPLPRVVGASHLTVHEAFAKIAAKGYEGTNEVLIGYTRHPTTKQIMEVRVPLAHHVDNVNCEARAHLGVVVMAQELNIPPTSLCKTWAFPGAGQSLLPLNEALSGPHGGVQQQYSFHVASAVLSDCGVLTLDVPLHPSGPVAVPVWHRQLQTPNNHPWQRQVTPCGQPPATHPQFLECGQPPHLPDPSTGVIAPQGQFGYYPASSEPQTPPACRTDAAAHMTGVVKGFPGQLGNPLPVLAPP